MKQYKKTIILSLVTLLFIALITFTMVMDFDFGIFKTLSISGISAKKEEVDDLQNEVITQEASYLSSKENLESSKNKFDVAKEEYENIPESKISSVKEATKEENYFIEYLWIVLGNYATANNVGIDILTPGATEVVEKNEDKKDEEKSSAAITEEGNEEQDEQNEQNASSVTSGIKIKVVGRYANIADFVFDVENDKELRFKLDNIVMKYSTDNKISATFDIISLMVEK